MDYLMESAANFGPLAWVFFVVQLILVAAGVYAGFVQRDPHPVRGPALRRLGYALTAFGAVGVLLGALRLAGVAPFTGRYWFYLVAVLEVLFAVYVAYYSRTVYPQQMAAASRTNRRGPAGRSTAGRVTAPQMPSRPTSQATARAANREASQISKAPGDQSVLVAEPPNMSKRRDSRRDRKRRKR